MKRIRQITVIKMSKKEIAMLKGTSLRRLLRNQENTFKSRKVTKSLPTERKTLRPTIFKRAEKEREVYG